VRRRLTNTHYDDAAKVFFGDDSRPVTHIPAATRLGSYDNQGE
jgi:hypothetical protein